MNNPSILIYGSCVSRDPFDSSPLRESDIVIKGYLSKTGVISQASAPLAANIPLSDGQDFLSRMVNLDATKGVGKAIGEIGGSFLLIDFIDERLPLIKSGDSYFTHTRSFVSSGLAKQIKGSYFNPVAEENFEIWQSSFDELAKIIKNSGVKDNKIILHKAWWARHVSDNGKLSRLDHKTLSLTHINNVFLKKAYDHVRGHFPGCNLLEMERDVIIADANHKWGADPFHYIPEYSEMFGQKLLNIIGLKAENASDQLQPIPQTKLQERRTAPISSANARMLENTSFYAGVTDTRDPFISSYGLLEPYLSHQKERVAKFRDAGIEFDENGIPRNTFRWGGPYYYSVTIGHHGLSSLARYVLAGDDAELKACIDTANWLLRNQTKNGAWPVEYDHDWYPQRCRKLIAPWVSAMGQGLCISFLTRFAATIEDRKLDIGMDIKALIDSATAALQPYWRKTRDGGVRAMLFDTYAFYEEYPTDPHSFVLNGYIYSLLGPYDLYLYNGDEKAEKLYRDAIETLEFALPLYDLGRGTAYDLTHITGKKFAPNIARPSYHYIHVQLLSALNIIEKNRFSDILERWNLYLQGWGARTN